MSAAAVRDQKSEISQRRARTQRARAFSLVEMMVVIAIVLLLFALTIGVVTSLSRSAETRTTQDALSILDQAYEEWKRNAERDVTYGKPDEPTAGMTYEIDQLAPSTPPGTGDDHHPTDELIDIIHRSSQIRDLLSKINPDLLIKHPKPEDDITMVDAWDTEIITVHPGRQWVPADLGLYGEKDVDGTIHTEFEEVFGVCTQRRVRFISAGPDGQFGNIETQLDYNDDETPDHADNIYSYPLENS